MKRGFLNTDKAKKRSGAHDVTPSAPTAVVQPEQLAVKLPIGKLDTTLPKDYNPAGSALFGCRSNALTTNYSDDAYVWATLPIRHHHETVADHPDNWAECLFRGGQAKLAILSTPRFPSSLRKPPLTRHRIGPSPHGLGMFATRNLKINDLIFSERPLLVVPQGLWLADVLPAGSTATFLQRTMVQMVEYEKILQICVDRMLPENRAAFFALHNCHTEDGSGPIFGRLRTNTIAITIKAASGKEHDLSAAFNELSRVNHSCTPNACYHFDVASFSCQLRAVGNVKKGEEIVIPYCQISVPTAERRENLKPYAFECTCRACSDHTSDALLASIQQSSACLPQTLQGYETKDLAIHEARLKNSLEWMSKIEAAGLQALAAYGTHLASAMASASGLNRQADYDKYGNMIVAWHEAVNGS